MKKKILLTGTSGFLGGNFLKSIIKDKVIVYDILREKNKNNKLLNNLKSKNKNYRSIYYKNNTDLKKNLHNKKFDILINFSTFYTRDHNYNDVNHIINSNINFPTALLDILSSNLKIFVNFGTMMEYENSNKFSPQNLYSSSKRAFEKITYFYQKKNAHCLFYNIKIFETYNSNDQRKKILPAIINTFIKRKKFYLAFKNLKINAVHTDDINNFLKKIINNKIPKGNYLIKNKKEIAILKLLKKIKKTISKNFLFSVRNKNKEQKFLKKYHNLKTVLYNTDIEKNIFKYLHENSKNKI